jgi:isocitrate dehydrogenase kinase/phosphatase
MTAFPHRLDSSIAFDIAQALLAGFNKHYRLFRESSRGAKQRFERADWKGQQRAQRERIEYYDQRVAEATEDLQRRFAAHNQPMEVWQQVKLHYIGLLTDHLQPELAETFFNSVSTKILHRSYFHNDFLFVRPAVSTDYLEDTEPGAPPVYRAYYPRRDGMARSIERLLTNFQLACEFVDLKRDVDYVVRALSEHFGALDEREGMLDQGAAGSALAFNFQIQVLSSLFFRNKGAYAIGKIVNGYDEIPFALPLLLDERGRVYVDTVLTTRDELLMLFSFARAYFMVDTAVPSAYVQFLRSLMPNKPRAELYSAIGLQKQGKTLFYRDFLAHLRLSSDLFIVAPGIRGLVMAVFTLPSFPYVFKCIKDHYPPPKDTTREQIQGKYLLVKQHDRVGRMADTWEYSNVAFPKSRFSDELVQELRTHCPSLLEEDGDDYIVKHVYIERRMVPLNLYLQTADDAALERAVADYGQAIKDLVAANIFPGDMLWKNFGVTRQGKVVFYDYDEIEYITDCNFRRVPQPRTEEEEMSGDIWYHVGKGDVFPETFATFLLGDARVRAAFMKHHPDLLDAAFWQGCKERIAAGHVHDVFPYAVDKRFCKRYAAAPLDAEGAVQGGAEAPAAALAAGA